MGLWLQGVEEVPGLSHKHSKPPFLEIQWVMLQHNSSIIYFKSVSFILQVNDRLGRLVDTLPVPLTEDCILAKFC